MILVTGATGFLGTHLVRRLTAERRAVCCVVRSTANVTALRQHSPELVTGDINDPPSLRQAMDGVTAVVHLVAIIRERGSATFHRINYLGTQAVVEAAQEARVPRFIHVSALGARPDPSFPYLYSKWRAEEAVANSGVPYVIFRPSVMFGEGDEFINMLAQLLRVSPIFLIPGSGKTPFQPIWVEDVVSCLIAALKRDDLLGRTLEIGGPQHLTYEEIVDTITHAIGVKRLKIHVPILLMRLAVNIMESLLPHPPATAHQLSMLQLDNTTQLTTLELTFGFQPATLATKIGYIQ